MADLFSGLGGGLVLLVVAAIGRTWTRYRSGKADKSVSVDSRLTTLEAGFGTLNDGLFGTDGPFGRQGGFVDEIRGDIKQLTAAVNRSNGH